MVTWELANTPIQPPVNADKLRIELNYDLDGPISQSVNAPTWEFSPIDSKILTNILNQGTNGGLGILEAPPLRGFKNGNEILSHVLDTTQAEWGEMVKLPSMEEGGIDWLRDIAPTLTFEYLYNPTSDVGAALISPVDFVEIPYIISEIPNEKEAFLVLLSLYIMAYQLATFISDMVSFLADVGNPFTSISTVIKLAAYILFLILQLAAIAKLIIDLVALVIQPVKYHSGMRLKTLLEKGATYFGKTFQSSMFDDPFWKDYVIIPEKRTVTADENDDRIFGFLTPNNPDRRGYYKGTYSQLLNAVKVLWNGKIRVTDTTISIERIDHNNSTALFQLPTNDGGRYNPFFTTNADRLPSSVSLRFQTDPTETNTITRYEGTECVTSTEPITIQNRSRLLLKNAPDYVIPFARCYRKNTLTTPEKILDAFLDLFGPLLNTLRDIVNTIIDILNEVIKAIKKVLRKLKTIGIEIPFEPEELTPLPDDDIGDLIDDRIGMLMLSNDYFEVPKCGSFDISSDPRDTKLKAADATRTHAGSLYDEFYKVSSFTPTPEFPNGFQYRGYKLPDVSFCYNDYLKVKDDNFILDENGAVCLLESLTWNPVTELADIVYWKNERYTDNLMETKFIPDGR